MKFLIFDDEQCKLHGLATKLADEYVMYVSPAVPIGEYLCPYYHGKAKDDFTALLKFTQPDCIIVGSDYWICQLDAFRKAAKKVVGLCEFTGIPRMHDTYEETLFNSLGISNSDDDPTHFVEGWWNGAGFTASAIIQKTIRMYDGERGTLAECTGVLAKRCADYDIEYLETLTKLEPYMKGLDYVGPVSIGYSVIDNHFYCRDLVLGFSRGVTPTLGEILPGATLDFYKNFLAGNHVKYDTDYAMGVEVRVEPYPFSKSKVIELAGFDPAKLKHFWAERLGLQNGIYYGKDNVGYVTAHAFSNKLLRERIYRITLKSLKNPQLVYRTDIGETPELRLLGV